MDVTIQGALALYYWLSWTTTGVHLERSREMLHGPKYYTDSHHNPYCSYFANRSPLPAPELRNCSWYKQVSCCRQIELDAIFKDIKPLVGANDKCQRILDYVICWVCDPNQHLFYSSSKQKLSFCLQFCDEILETCKDAYFKGQRMGDFYRDGRDFCKSHSFQIPQYFNESCFDGGRQEGKREWTNIANRVSLSPMALILFWSVILLLTLRS